MLVYEYVLTSCGNVGDCMCGEDGGEGTIKHKDFF